MLLRDQLLIVARLLNDGDASRYDQRQASRVLSRVAYDVERIEQLLDSVVGEAHAEEHLLAVSERRNSFRVVSR
jgi:hypothetical protein